MRLPDPNLPWPIPLAAVAIIAEREGCRLRTYKCPAGVWTIGWGETAPEKARPGATCTQQQADRWLLEDLQRRAVRVQTMLTVHAEPNQLGALVSLAYNIGIEALARSTVVKRHNAGDPEAAARAFGLWNKARVKGQLQVLPGLTARRAAEAALYLTPEPDAPRERMPQAVAAESSIAASPIAQGGAVTAGTGALALLQEAGAQATPVGDALGKVKEIVVGTLGVPADLFLPVVLLAAGAAVLYWRWKQRSGGWC
jgi:lysozyme